MFLLTTNLWGEAITSDDIPFQTVGALVGGIAGASIANNSGLDPVHLGAPLGMGLGMMGMNWLRGKPVKPVESIVCSYWGTLLVAGSSSLFLDEQNQVGPQQIGPLSALSLLSPLLSAYSYLVLTGKKNE